MHIDTMQIHAKMHSMITRTISATIQEYLDSSDTKIFFIWGPRRSGKTTLMRQLSKKLHVPLFNFDFLTHRAYFAPTIGALSKLAHEHNVILIDEVQNYPESTLALKLLHDEFNIKIIATGSSELRQKSNQFDTLASRYTQHYCLPLSLDEFQKNASIKPYESKMFQEQLARNIQIFGAYPEVHCDPKNTQEQKIEILQTILESYVLKDIIQLYDLKNEKLALDILTKIALQIGSEVSLRELANSLGANATTVSNYIEIFIKNYILIPLPSFKTNARKAVSEHRKLYFYDLGIRNILVRDFRDLELRPDRGGVFENFIISEIEKKRLNTGTHRTLYFYREYAGKEIDLVVEDYKKEYHCYEIKNNNTKGNVNLFPLPHAFSTINNTTCFEEIEKVF